MFQMFFDTLSSIIEEFLSDRVFPHSEHEDEEKTHERSRRVKNLIKQLNDKLYTVCSLIYCVYHVPHKVLNLIISIPIFLLELKCLPSVLVLFTLRAKEIL